MFSPSVRLFHPRDPRLGTETVSFCDSFKVALLSGEGVEGGRGTSFGAGRLLSEFGRKVKNKRYRWVWLFSEGRCYFRNSTVLLRL